MKFLNPLILGSFTVNLLSLGVVAYFQISKNVSSTAAVTARQSALTNIAKHVLSDSCWNYPADEKLKIGDAIATKGSATGKLPTSCVYSPKTGQFIEAGYLNNELQVLRIFSLKEVQASKSQLLSNRNN